jgi:phosphopantetheinyl transferase
MPIDSFTTLSSTSFLLIWKIEETLDVLYPQLHHLFLSDFHSCNFSSKERMRQSIAVRLALCCLLQKLNLPIVPLSKNAQGKPFLENSKLHLSFSHTPYLAAATISTSFPIGIDIEIIRPKLGVVQEKVLTQNESKNAHNSLEKLAIYWCAKETLYKLFGRQQICTFKHIFVEPFQLKTAGIIVANLNQKKYLMSYKREDKLATCPHFWVSCEDVYA